MINNIYKQLVDLANEAEKKTAGLEYPLFSHYKDDLFIYDKNTLELDSQAGDKYVWLIKGNGCGTELLATGLEHSSFVIKNADPQGKFYTIECSGINEGVVKQISQEKALAYSEKHPWPESRVPRRKSLVTVLDDLIGFDSDKASIRHYRIINEFTPTEKEKCIVKVTCNSANTLLQIIRPNMVAEPSVRAKRANEVYYFPVTAKSRSELLGSEPKYFALTTTQQGYAEIAETTKRVFDSAVKKTQENSRKDELSLG